MQVTFSEETSLGTLAPAVQEALCAVFSKVPKRDQKQLCLLEREIALLSGGHRVTFMKQAGR